MANYVILGNFTDQGIRGIKDTTKRAKAFRDLAEDMGGSIKDIYWTLGAYDIVLMMEAPDDETVTAILMKVGSLGNLKSQTLRAFNEAEISSIISRI